MKLISELQETINRMERIKDSITAYIPRLKEIGGYNDFETRFVNDVLRAIYTPGEMCMWYDQYDCNDSHITTLGKRAVKSVLGEGWAS